MKFNIYVASSWKNTYQPEVVKILKEKGHRVYDFKHATRGLNWADIDPNYKEWGSEDLAEGLKHELTTDPYNSDMVGLYESNICLMVLPCGKSAHLELGYAVGIGMRTIILLGPQQEPELMYKMADKICTDMNQVVDIITRWEDDRQSRF